MSDSESAQIVEVLASGTETRIMLSHPEVDHVQSHIARTRSFYEQPMLEHASRYIRPGDLAIDVGAHIGNHTLYMANVCKARVIAFEPYGPSFELLTRNVQQNGLGELVVSHHAAVGAQASRASVVPPSQANTGQARVLSNPVGDVALVTLDEACKGLSPALIKVDVEGGEVGVLRGAEQTIRAHQPVLYVECASHGSLAEIAGLLREWEYIVGPRFNATTTFCFLPAASHGVLLISEQLGHHAHDVSTNHRSLARRLEEIRKQNEQLARQNEQLSRQNEQFAEALAATRKEVTLATDALARLNPADNPMNLGAIADMLTAFVSVSEGHHATVGRSLRELSRRIQLLEDRQAALATEVAIPSALRLLPNGPRRKTMKLIRAPRAFLKHSSVPLLRSLGHSLRGAYLDAATELMPSGAKRKLKKLQGTPERFFEDSQNEVVRRYGPRAYDALRKFRKAKVAPAPVIVRTEPPKVIKTVEPADAIGNALRATIALPSVSVLAVVTNGEQARQCARLATLLPESCELLVVGPQRCETLITSLVRGCDVPRLRGFVVPTHVSRGGLLSFAMGHALGADVVLDAGRATADVVLQLVKNPSSSDLEVVSGAGPRCIRIKQRLVARMGFLANASELVEEEYVRRFALLAPSSPELESVALPEAVTAWHQSRLPQGESALFVHFPDAGGLSEAFRASESQEAETPLPEVADPFDDFDQDRDERVELFVYGLPLPGTAFFSSVEAPSALCIERVPQWMNVTQAPLVSVVMTTFNAERTVLMAARSILSQSYRNLELIIVDDCSQDSTPKLCLALADEDPRVRVLQAPRNSGTYWCKNYGILHSKGAFVAFQDADDISSSVRVEIQARALLANPSWPACTTCYQRSDEQSRVVWLGGFKDRGGRITLMTRRSILNKTGYFDSVRVAADDEFLSRVQIASKHAVVRLPSVHYWALFAEGSLTTAGPAPIHYEGAVARLSPLRRKYWEAAKEWHARLKTKDSSPYLRFPQVRRPFPAPSELLPTKKVESTSDIVATMATMPSRVDALQRTIASLLPQVDRIFIYLNNFQTVPAFLEHPRITLARSQEHGDRKDNGKFFFLPELNRCYHFTVDDDIIYPPDYVQKSILAIERYGRRAAVGVHGVNLADPLVRFTRSRDVLHFESELLQDEAVQLLGTGTVAYHTESMRLSVDDFGKPGMADLWFAIACRKKGVPLIAQARPAKWLVPIEVGGDRLFVNARQNDRFETELAQQHGPWTRAATDEGMQKLAAWARETYKPLNLHLQRMDAGAIARATGAEVPRVRVHVFDDRTDTPGLQRRRGAFTVAGVAISAALSLQDLEADDILVLVRSSEGIHSEALRTAVHELVQRSELDVVVDAMDERDCRVMVVKGARARELMRGGMDARQAWDALVVEPMGHGKPHAVGVVRLRPAGDAQQPTSATQAPAALPHERKAADHA